MQYLFDFTGRHGRAEIVALDLVAVLFAQELKLLFRLDSLGNDLEVQHVT